MLGFILFIFLVAAIGGLILYSNKSTQAQEIKNVLKKILENLKAFRALNSPDSHPPFINWTTATFLLWPIVLSAIPRAAVVLPLP